MCIIADITLLSSKKAKQNGESFIIGIYLIIFFSQVLGFAAGLYGIVKKIRCFNYIFMATVIISIASDISMIIIFSFFTTALFMIPIVIYVLLKIFLFYKSFDVDRVLKSKDNELIYINYIKQEEHLKIMDFQNQGQHMCKCVKPNCYLIISI